MVKKITVLYLIIHALIFNSYSVSAQLDNATINKVKVIYLNAENKYKAKAYYECLEKIEEIEVVTDGMRIPTAQNLKVKALLGANEYLKAKEELEVLQGLNLSDEILQDMASYTDEIEKGADAFVLNPVKIGDLIWSDKNLNVSTFRNGDEIPQVKNKEEWIKAGLEQQPAWCYYQNDPNNAVSYGKLYNKWAIEDERGLAPEGWRIAEIDDWKALMNELDTHGSANCEPKTICVKLSNSGTTQLFGEDVTKKLGGRRIGEFRGANAFCTWRSRTNAGYTRFIEFARSSNKLQTVNSWDEQTLFCSGGYVRCIKEE